MEETKTIQVKVYSTQMGERTVQTNAVTWDDLQVDLTKAGITFAGMKVVIGESKHVLEAGGSSVPQEDFTLFLMNKKTKAGYGNMSYRNMRSEIQSLVNSSDEAKAFFNKGRNYTTKKTEELRTLLIKWSKTKKSPSKATPSTNSAKKVAKKVEKKTAKEVFKEKIEKIAKEENFELTDVDKISQVVRILEKLDSDKIYEITGFDIKYDFIKPLNNIKEDLIESDKEEGTMSDKYYEIAKEFKDVK